MKFSLCQENFNNYSTKGKGMSSIRLEEVLPGSDLEAVASISGRLKGHAPRKEEGRKGGERAPCRKCLHRVLKSESTPKVRITTPENRFTQINRVRSTLSLSRFVDPLNISHQRAEPINTPVTIKVAEP